MKRWIASMVSMLFASGASVACGADMPASDEIGRWYIAPKLGATFTDSSRDADDDLFYGLALGKHLNDDWSAELNLVSGKHDGERNASKLAADSSAVLDPHAVSLKSHPGLKIELQGHTDAVGSAPYNLKLSQARAAAVREYLLAQGVAASALIAKGYGEAQPVADNAIAAGRAQNRRVVMVVLENPGEVEVKQSGDVR